MSYKVFIYLCFGVISALALSGVNFDVIIKKNRIWEARFLFIVLTMALGYLAGSFLIEFFEV